MASTQKLKIFLIGATGCIGGSVLTHLLNPSISFRFEITVLTRKESTIEKFKELGVNSVLGSLDSSELLTKLAEESDIVINISSSDHLQSIKDIIKGLQKPGKKRIFIHTSGAGTLCDDSKGNFASEKIYSDLDMKSIYDLPLTQIHKPVDDYIFKHQDGYDCIIVAPPTVYGNGDGPFSQTSLTVSALIRAFIKIGHAGTIGKGENFWNCVHVRDLADFYVFLLEKTLKGEADVGQNGWYFYETGEYKLKDLTQKVAESMKKNKLLTDDKITELTQEEIETGFGERMGKIITGGNSRCKAERGRKLGWKESGKFPKIDETVEDDVKKFVNEEKSH